MASRGRHLAEVRSRHAINSRRDLGHESRVGPAETNPVPGRSGHPRRLRRRGLHRCQRPRFHLDGLSDRTTSGPAGVSPWQRQHARPHHPAAFSPGPQSRPEAPVVPGEIRTAGTRPGHHDHRGTTGVPGVREPRLGMALRTTTGDNHQRLWCPGRSTITSQVARRPGRWLHRQWLVAEVAAPRNRALGHLLAIQPVPPASRDRRPGQPLALEISPATDRFRDLARFDPGRHRCPRHKTLWSVAGCR